MIPKTGCQLCVAIAPTKRRHTLSHTCAHHDALFTDCSNTRPYTSTISTSYRSKQQHETYLQLDCGLAESNAPANCKHPISFHRSRLPCALPPCRERQAERASHEQTAQQRANETICAACFLGDAPSNYPVELLLASSSITKRRSGGRYLLVIMRAGGIGVSEGS